MRYNITGVVMQIRRTGQDQQLPSSCVIIIICGGISSVLDQNPFNFHTISFYPKPFYSSLHHRRSVQFSFGPPTSPSDCLLKLLLCLGQRKEQWK